ncbi:MAG: dephospho-CoA kinase [Lachnospiraceae bacterium]|nr:dephospho-CoA kinase [Lachnospiraceae bacterium]
MKVIGITGGVGCGKSEVMKILKEVCDPYIIIADDTARELEKKGGSCYEELLELLGKEMLSEDGEIDRRRMAAAVFSDESGELLDKVNEIVHPKVKEYIREKIEEEKRKGVHEYFFIEAALLIEDGYDKICDELWYIYADVSVRKERLKKSRGYSDEKIEGIMDSQNSEEVFRRYCKVVIDNNGDLERTRREILRYI